DDIKKPNIKVYRIDDLEEISKNNFALRQEQALIAEEIVKKYKEDFLKWLQALAIEPVIKQMRLDILDVVDYEVNRVIKKGFFPKEYEENLRHMAIQLFDKYLHNPTKNLRAISKGSNAQEVIDAIKSVFNIETNDIDPSIYKKGNR
ncbi:MAG: glutamyl-tRNA reductase, partial [Epsilonproteobacteria bacterium]|nr:glutamyl-tRNA reductase [Campylobacterota bacterium]